MKQYNIEYNKNKISNLKLTKLEKEKVHEYVNIDDELLTEKDNWYVNKDKNLYFFKNREDDRLVGECLSQKIVEKLGKESATYDIVYLNDKLGLFTKNFQDINENEYYDFYNIYKLYSIFPKGYNTLTFKNILEYLSYQDISNKEFLIQDLIDRYVLEWVTHQTDGNVRNTLLYKKKGTNELKVAPSFDKEKCFGIDSKGIFNIEEAKSIWLPAIPYDDIEFRNNPYLYDDNIDVNILGLYLDYPNQTEEAFEKIFSIKYENIFGEYTNNIHQFILGIDTIEYLCDIIEYKDRQKKKIISL